MNRVDHVKAFNEALAVYLKRTPKPIQLTKKQKRFLLKKFKKFQAVYVNGIRQMPELDFKVTPRCITFNRYLIKHEVVAITYTK